MYKMIDEKDILALVLDCGSFDIEVLLDEINLALELDRSTDITDIIDESVSYDGRITFGGLMYVAMRIVNDAIFEDVKHKVKELDIDEDIKNELISMADDRIEKFEPYINYLDSHYNNEIDDSDGADEIIEEWISQIEEEK